jgi:hypothetical protein
MTAVFALLGYPLIADAETGMMRYNSFEHFQRYENLSSFLLYTLVFSLMLPSCTIAAVEEQACSSVCMGLFCTVRPVVFKVPVERFSVS